MITIIQIILILFAVFAWSRAGLRIKDKEIGVGEFAFWSVIWIGVIIFASLPGILERISKIFGIARPTDFAVYIGIIVLFYLVFRAYVNLDKQSKEITRLVREIAIKKKK